MTLGCRRTDGQRATYDAHDHATAEKPMGPPFSSLGSITSIKQPFWNFGRTISENAAISTIAASRTEAKTDRDDAPPVKATAPPPAGPFLQNEPNWDNSNDLRTLKPGPVP
jgi:hypothetical protein